ncbi:MAG: M28 family peptidase [Sphingomonadales bacterium]|nr:M28 family peptidase [Sphingomonadales bacterium]
MWATSVPGQSYTGPLPPQTASQALLSDNLRRHVTAIASVPHNIYFRTNLENSGNYIEQYLTDLGYKVHLQKFDAKSHQFRNIEVIVGNDSRNSETLIIGAHYDSFGKAPGANDNGSGVAALLELARLFKENTMVNGPKIRLVFFVNEEPPHFKSSNMGSLVYAKAIKNSGENISGMFSLETMGYYSDAPNSQSYPWPLNLRYSSVGNFIAFVGQTSSRSFVRSTVESFRYHTRFPSIGGTAPAIATGIDWSDHWAFEQVGIPALMITDTAIFRYPHYHKISDTPDKIDYAKLARVIEGLEAVVRHWGKERG